MIGGGIGFWVACRYMAATAVMNWMKQAMVSSFGGDQCGGQERSATASRRIPVAGDARAHFEARIPSITSFQSDCHVTGASVALLEHAPRPCSCTAADNTHIRR